MAVVDNSSSTPQGRESEKKSSGSWFKKNKGLAILGGAGAVILLLSHKGASTSSNDASTIASDAAAEQAAIDQAVQGASTASDLAAGSAAGGGGGDSGSDTTGSDTVASAAGPGPTVPGETVNINEAAPQITINSPGAGLQTGVASRTLTAPPLSVAAAPGDVSIGGNIYGSAAHNQADAKAQAAATQKAAAKVNPPKAKKGARSASMTIEPASKPKTHTKGSVMKYGRAFPTAQSVHVGRGQRTSDGVLHEPVTVNYGGFSETHISHNRGESWTDNAPGYTPPSRGVPLARLGTA